MKKFITSFCMIALVSYGVFAQFTIESGVLTAYTGTDEDVVIPNDVTAVSANVFKDNKTIKSVSGDNVILLGANVFWGCSNLTTVNFPKVETISSTAFRDNTSLSVANFGSVKTIGADAFVSCRSLESFDFSKVISIGTDAFADCVKLGPTITLPASLMTYGGNSFAGCINLQNIEIDAANTIWKSVDGILFTKDEFSPAIASYPSGRTGSYTVPDEITIIGFGSFARSQLEELDLNYADEIGDYGLYLSKITKLTANYLRTTKLASFRQVQLDSIALPALRTIGQNTFLYNKTLRIIDLHKATNLKTIGNEPFKGTTKEITVYVANQEIKDLLAAKSPSNIKIEIKSSTGVEGVTYASKLYIETYNKNLSVDVSASPAGNMIHVFDVSGKLVLIQYISENNTANLCSLKEGVYLIKIGANSAKIII